MKSISIKGVIIGAIFDIAASAILGMLFVLIVALSGPGVTAEQLTTLLGSTEIRIGIYVIGSVVSVAAGYLAAWIANRHEFLNGTLSSILCVLSGIHTLVFSHPQSVLLNLLLLLVSPLLGLLGGYLRYVRRQGIRGHNT